MRLPFICILLLQHRVSEDNKDCTCEFDDDFMGVLVKANPACPVQGHRYSCVVWIAVAVYALCTVTGGEA